MQYYNSRVPQDVELKHYGVSGMKWGVIRSNRYVRKSTKFKKKAQKSFDKAVKRSNSFFDDPNKTVADATKAGRYVNKAGRYAEQGDRTVRKMETKYNKQVSRNEKKLQKLKAHGMDQATIDEHIAKATKFVDDYKNVTIKLKASKTQEIRDLDDEIERFTSRYISRHDRSKRTFD